MQSNLELVENLRITKQHSLTFAQTSSKLRNDLLLSFASELLAQTNLILDANKADLLMAETSLSTSLLARLKLSRAKLEQVVDGISQIAELEDPLAQQPLVRELDAGLVLRKKIVPLGLIAFVFESRPDVLPQIIALSIKTGNGLVFKGGVEAANTLSCIYSILISVFEKSVLGQATPFLQLHSREEFQELLLHPELIDLVIPRGSNTLVQNIMSSSKIQVLGHADGVCNIYVSGSADQKLAIDVITDSKVQYPAACNAVEVVLINSAIARNFLPELTKCMQGNNVKVYVCPRCLEIDSSLKPFNGDDWHVEYSDLSLAICIVDSDDQAINHINQFGSHHTDCIISEDPHTQEHFTAHIDSADVFINCSTRFADGYRFGFGAEVGISTSKLHARGPVGLEGLCTYKYILSGNGQVVADYVNGTKSFSFKTLK